MKLAWSLFKLWFQRLGTPSWLLFGLQIGERDRLKNEIEHEQRITMEVESWLRDRQANLNQLVCLIYLPNRMLKEAKNIARLYHLYILLYLQCTVAFLISLLRKWYLNKNTLTVAANKIWIKSSHKPSKHLVHNKAGSRNLHLFTQWDRVAFLMHKNRTTLLCFMRSVWTSLKLNILFVGQYWNAGRQAGRCINALDNYSLNI